MSKADKQTYAYCRNKSIIGNVQDEYELSQDEYYMLYSFYVTYSMCGNQSAKKRTFADYGWATNSIKNTELEQKLKGVIDLNKNSNFNFTDKNDLKEQFAAHDLSDGTLSNYDLERAVIGKTSASNQYLKLFYRIRDGFAHGKFLLKLSSNQTKMVVIQDDDTHNVTARIVIKLSTLLDFVECIDKNKLIICKTIRRIKLCKQILNSVKLKIQKDFLTGDN